MRFARWMMAAGVLAALAAMQGCATPVAPTSSIAPSAIDAYGRGVAALRSGDRVLARGAFESAVAIAPQFVAAHRELQNLRLAAFEAEAVQREYRVRWETMPTAAAAYLFGRLQHRYEDQLALFLRATEIDPELVWGWYGRSYIESVTGRPRQALASAERAIAVSPHHAPSRLQRARTLAQLERFAEAGREVESALALDDADPVAWQFAARLAGARGRRSDELHAITRLLRIEPGNAEALEHLAAVVRRSPWGPEGSLAMAALEAAARRSYDGKLAGLLADAHDRRGEIDASRTWAARATASGRSGPEALAIRRRRDPLAPVELWSDHHGVPVTPDTTPRLAAVREARNAMVRATPDESAAAEVRYLAALERAGWHDTARAWRLDVADRRGPLPADDERLLILDRIADHGRVVARLRLLVEELQIDQAEPARHDVEAFILEAVDIIRDETGIEAGDDNRVLKYPFAGEVLDCASIGKNSLNAYFARYNQMLFCGRIADGKTQVMLFNTVGPPRTVRPDWWYDRRGYVEVLGEAAAIRPRDEIFGDTAGRALDRVFYVDLDVTTRWGRDLVDHAFAIPEETRRRLLDSDGLAADQEERVAISMPLNAFEALLLRAIEIHGDLPVLDTIRAHERGHLHDARRYLPLWEHFLQNLMLAAAGGFSPRGVMAILEEDAQLHALATGPAPHLVLAEMVRAIPRGADAGPHSVGYGRLLRRFVARLASRIGAFPSIRPDRTLLHQLHHLTEDEIRRIAADL